MKNRPIQWPAPVMNVFTWSQTFWESKERADPIYDSIDKENKKKNKKGKK